MKGDLVKFLIKNAELRMAEMGLNQGQLADKIGVRRATLNNILNGKSAPGAETIEAIAEGLEMAASDLISDPTEERSRLKAMDLFLNDYHERVVELKGEIKKLKALIGPHAPLLKALKKATPAQVGAAYAPFPGLEVPEGVIGEDK